jgi:hypothetical protein
MPGEERAVRAAKTWLPTAISIFSPPCTNGLRFLRQRRSALAHSRNLRAACEADVAALVMIERPFCSSSKSAGLTREMALWNPVGHDRPRARFLKRLSACMPRRTGCVIRQDVLPTIALWLPFMASKSALSV